MYPAPALSRILAVQPLLDAIERDQAAPRTAFEHLKIGQAVTGLVKSQTKGISLVTIDGHTVAMRLPRPVETGDTLKLSFAGHMPQPVFLLDAPETVATDAPQLSQTARMLSDFMQRVPERGLPTLTPPGPLLDQPTANPAEMALALRAALVRSGLFYESHLANWVVGKDSLDGLMQEPQNRLAAEAARSATALALPDASGAVEQKTANPMHTLLSQQLQVLESPNFIWKGELWPGQTLEWQLRQETDPQSDASAAPSAHEAETGWESHLKLSLPQLGTLNVHIKLDARQAFSIRVAPEQADTAPLLQNNQAVLIERLAAAGCTLHALTVQPDADA
jgi:Flagellar hook-length control protein FliK